MWAYRYKTGQPVTGGATLVVSVNVMPKLVFFIHIYAEKKKLIRNLNFFLILCIGPPTEEFFLFRFHRK